MVRVSCHDGILKSTPVNIPGRAMLKQNFFSFHNFPPDSVILAPNMLPQSAMDYIDVIVKRRGGVASEEFI